MKHKTLTCLVALLAMTAMPMLAGCESFDNWTEDMVRGKPRTTMEKSALPPTSTYVPTSKNTLVQNTTSKNMAAKKKPFYPTPENTPPAQGNSIYPATAQTPAAPIATASEEVKAPVPAVVPAPTPAPAAKPVTTMPSPAPVYSYTTQTPRSPDSVNSAAAKPYAIEAVTPPPAPVRAPAPAAPAIVAAPAPRPAPVLVPPVTATQAAAAPAQAPTPAPVPAPAISPALKPVAAEKPMMTEKPAPAQTFDQSFDPQGDYTLGPGDQLRITVYGQEELTGQYKVDAKGFISFPLIGKVAATGRTTTQMEDTITNGLNTGFIVDPRVSIEVMNYRPVYVLGEVREPGKFEYAPGMTVLQAIASAGGYTYRADEDEADVTRRAGSGQETISVKPSDMVKPGDTIVVKRRWF